MMDLLPAQVDWLKQQSPETEANRKVAAAYLNLRPATLAKYAADRVGPPFRKSCGEKGTTFYTKAALDAWKKRGMREVADIPA